MDPSRPSFLLVDGNNVIHAWPELLRLHQRKRGSAHSELIRRMADYRGFTGTRIVIVFDGRGAVTTDERLPEGIQVLYSSASHTADDIIERLALKYAEIYDIQVATDDRAEQDIVVGAGGSVVSVENFIQLWERSERDRDRWLERHRRS